MMRRSSWLQWCYCCCFSWWGQWKLEMEMTWTKCYLGWVICNRSTQQHQRHKTATRADEAKPWSCDDNLIILHGPTKTWTEIPISVWVPCDTSWFGHQIGDTKIVPPPRKDPSVLSVVDCHLLFAHLALSLSLCHPDKVFWLVYQMPTQLVYKL